ncbi:DUF899 family protein [Phenylobacterium sp.]|uniref:DUF899 family protein n=1 Tax=Phenylobacterium sp. TaxID=1871053 RepID=UPI00271AEF1B|nr:DUF899 family protein [Phenylobacterium sp.]MDO8379108.1 DUF899 family protein [Phenylobacterium sp.]
MNYVETKSALEAKRAQIASIREEMRAIQVDVEPQAVEDYELCGWEGPVRLSQLFGDKPDLILIHNMGRGCSSCTMWADGFNGVYDHLASRAAFVVSSPDPVEVQREFAKGRGWRFPMVSHAGTNFALDMGYRRADASHGGYQPGVSAFRKEGDRILRLSDTELGPMDDFCVYYHLMEMIPGGDAEFTPKFS